MNVMLARQGHIGYNTRMKINSILDVAPETASDIRYLWDESGLNSESIASSLAFSDGDSIPIEVIWDILGGAYVYEDHKN